MQVGHRVQQLAVNPVRQQADQALAARKFLAQGRRRQQARTQPHVHGAMLRQLVDAAAGEFVGNKHFSVHGVEHTAIPVTGNRQAAVSADRQSD